jgi:hypothetical protein
LKGEIKLKTMKLRTRIISAIIAGGLVLSTAGIAFATTNTNVAPIPGLPNPMTAELKTAVSSNIITQDESDKILAYISSKTTATDKAPKIGVDGPNLFKELVSNNILTQTKADALKASEDADRYAQRQLDLKTKISTLVTKNTITKDQADKITAAINTSDATEKAARDAEKTKTDAMTDAQRKTYMESKIPDKVDPLKALVTNGTITQSQADAVNALLPVGPGKGGPLPGGPLPNGPLPGSLLPNGPLPGSLLPNGPLPGGPLPNGKGPGETNATTTSTTSSSVTVK